MTNDWAKDAVVASTTIGFGFFDALKHMMGWRLEVRLAIETENVIGRTVGMPPQLSAVAPSWWPKPKAVGYIEAAPIEEDQDDD